MRREDAWRSCAGWGGAVWLVSSAAGAESAVGIGLVDHLFLLALLVVVPLGMAARPVQGPLARWAARFHPFIAVAATNARGRKSRVTWSSRSCTSGQEVNDGFPVRRSQVHD
jgi:hypothetical protein